jgi:hypothetical protein
MAWWRGMRRRRGMTGLAPSPRCKRNESTQQRWGDRIGKSEALALPKNTMTGVRFDAQTAGARGVELVADPRSWQGLARVLAGLPSDPSSSTAGEWVSRSGDQEGQVGQPV